MEKFKIGDKIRMKSSCSGAVCGQIYTLYETNQGLCTKLEEGNNACGCSCNEEWELVTNNQSTMSSLKDIVSGFFITEPQKSRLTAGITDKEGQLTSEGKEVYLNYLLSKDTSFDAEIVAKVIAAQEKNK